MKELIEKLEAAHVADRELDAEIALATGFVRKREGNIFYGNKDHSCLVLEGDYYDHGGNAPELPYFTSSLDAALKLVPEGWLWDVASTGAAWVMPFDNLDAQIVVGGITAPALAMCIAALKARSQA